MKALFAAIGSFFAAVGLYGLLIALIFGVSWIVTCGIVYLVSLCFGWTFSWGIATGVWLVILLIKWIFDRGNK